MNVINLGHYRTLNTTTHRVHGTPVRPHDPADRILIGKITTCPLTTKFSTWEIRAFDRTGPFHLYFSARDMLHLQIWNPYHRVSVLTPSKITGHHYEAFPLYDWKLTAQSYVEIGREINKQFSTALPKLCDVALIAKEYYMISDSEISHTVTLNPGAG